MTMDAWQRRYINNSHDRSQQILKSLKELDVLVVAWSLPIIRRSADTQEGAVPRRQTHRLTNNIWPHDSSYAGRVEHFVLLQLFLFFCRLVSEMNRSIVTKLFHMFHGNHTYKIRSHIWGSLTSQHIATAYRAGLSALLSFLCFLFLFSFTLSLQIVGLLLGFLLICFHFSVFLSIILVSVCCIKLAAFICFQNITVYV